MKLRLQGLTDVDPLAVPLPHGTEVITRVDRVAGEHKITQGAVGRVVGSEQGMFDVNIVGVGVVRYLREEIQPRKLGQVRFALRRESAWSALMPCVVLDTVVGSRAWGLAGESSDTDRRGIFVLPFSWTIGLVEPPVDLVSADGSATYWEMGKAFRQALRADPNTLEVLFVDAVEVLDPMGEWILEERQAFVSQEIYGSFGRYALSQLKRLEQSQRLAAHRHLIVDWLRKDASLSLDEVATRLARATGMVAPTAQDTELRAKEYVKQLYRSMYDQGLLGQREFAALVEYAREHASGTELDLPRELRPKNAYNLIRLLDTAIQWLRTGEVCMRVRDELRPTLIAIKSGEVPLADVLAMARDMTPALEEARTATRLPEQADVARVDALMRRIRHEVARRHIHGEPGPFGAEAAPLPIARWEP